MTSCANCFQHTTVFDRLNTLLNDINTFSGKDMRLLVKHPITVTDSILVKESISVEDISNEYVLTPGTGLVSLGLSYHVADIFEIYNYHLIAP